MPVYSFFRISFELYVPNQSMNSIVDPLREAEMAMEMELAMASADYDASDGETMPATGRVLDIFEWGKGMYLVVEYRPRDYGMVDRNEVDCKVISTNQVLSVMGYGKGGKFVIRHSPKELEESAAGSSVGVDANPVSGPPLAAESTPDTPSAAEPARASTAKKRPGRKPAGQRK